MKQMIIIISITTIFILLAIWANVYLTNSSLKVTSHLENIDTYVKNQSWSDAEKELKTAEYIWEGLSDKWATIIEHEEIDKIEMSLTKISKYVENKDPTEAIAENSNLKLLIKHIPELYTLDIKNIL